MARRVQEKTTKKELVVRVAYTHQDLREKLSRMLNGDIEDRFYLVRCSEVEMDAAEGGYCGSLILLVNDRVGHNLLTQTVISANRFDTAQNLSSRRGDLTVRPYLYEVSVKQLAHLVAIRADKL